MLREPLRDGPGCRDFSGVQRRDGVLLDPCRDYVPSSLLDGFDVLDMEEQEPVGLTAPPSGRSDARLLRRRPLAADGGTRPRGLPLSQAGLSACSYGSLVLVGCLDCYIVLPCLDPRRFDPSGELAVPRRLSREASKGRCRERCASFFAPSRYRAPPPMVRVGTLEAIQVAALTGSSEGRGARAVVLAVDSLVDEPALLWLAESNRLKEDENPVGLVPGEGGGGVRSRTGTARVRARFESACARRRPRDCARGQRVHVGRRQPRRRARRCRPAGRQRRACPHRTGLMC